MSNATEHREVEFKFRVPASVTIDLPALLESIGSGVTRLEPRPMTATYYDTPNLSLIRWGITMRHRLGGGDDGWHLKIPVASATGTTARDEIHVDASPVSIPLEFASITAPLVRRQELLPLALVRTDRQPFELRTVEGTPLVEVVDDRVTVAPADDPETVQSFHEIEVELINDSSTAQHLASEISRALLRSGALASSVSKAAQAFGPAAADAPDVPQLDFPDPSAPAIDALQAIFARYVRDLLIADVGVRRGTDDSVHQMRVACRRLRSSLRTFEAVLDPESVTFLRDELRWLANELGEVRDTEVQRERLSGLTQDEALRDFIRTTLDARLRAANSGAMAALRSDRHDFLLEDLILLVGEPPVTSGAFEPAADVLKSALHSPWTRLRSSVRKAQRSNSAEDWHRVRLRAKQSRYAVESVAPVLGSTYGRLGKALAKITDTLGQRQDARVAGAMLAELAVEAPGHIAFKLGLLAAHNESAGEDDIRAFHGLWSATVGIAQEVELD